MRFKDYFILVMIFLVISLIVFSAILGDEFSIIIVIIIGVIIVLLLAEGILEKISSRNKVSKKLEKLAGWIRDNIYVG